MTLNEIKFFGFSANLVGKVSKLRELRKAGDWTGYVDTIEEIVILVGGRFGQEKLAQSAKLVSDAVQKKDYADAAKRSAEFVLVLVSVITGVPESTFSTMSDSDAEETIIDNYLAMAAGQTSSVSALNEDPKTEAIPPALVFGLIRLFIQWRLSR